MKIIHIIPSLASGGAERMLSKICEYDDKNQHVVITLLKNKVHYNVSNAEIIELGYSNKLIHKIILIKKLYELIQEKDPDLIQTWMNANIYGIILKRIRSLKKIKFVSNFRNGYSETPNRLTVYLYNKLFQSLDGHIFVSNSALAERMKVGFKYNNYKIINNGFSIPNSVNSINNKTLSIGHMGRFHEIKNQKMLINAFSIFMKKKDTKLILAGRGLNSNNLNFKDIPETKLVLMDEIENTEKFYEIIDVFVLTSYSEGFPNVIGESMSYGVPVIATDAGESWKIIDNTGFKITSTDDLIKCLEKIYYNRNLLKEKSNASKNKIIDNYSIEKTIKEYQIFYNMIGEL